MDHVAPLGGVYQAGTLSGNPVAVAAGIANLKALKHKDYAALNKKTTELCDSLEGSFGKKREAVTINRAGSLFTIFFTKGPVYDFTDAKRSDTKKYAQYFWSMMRKGINLPPSQFEAQFLSFSHTGKDLGQICKAV